MLSDYLKLYKEQANLLDFDWNNISRHELMLKYCDMLDSNHDKKNNCLSALIVRYWSFIITYAKRSFNAYKDTDVYDWVVDAIIKTSKNRPWLNENSKLFTNKNASELCIKVEIFERRQDRFKWANRPARAGNYNGKTFELDKLLEDGTMDEWFADESFENSVLFSYDIVNYIKKQEENSNYMTILIVDGILYGDVFTLWKSPHILNKKKALHHIKTIPESYLKGMSKRYGLNLDKLRSAYNSIKNYTQGKLDRQYKKALDNFCIEWRKTESC